MARRGGGNKCGSARFAKAMGPHTYNPTGEKQKTEQKSITRGYRFSETAQGWDWKKKKNPRNWEQGHVIAVTKGGKITKNRDA